MKRKLTASLLIGILVASLALVGCDWGKVDRRVTVAAYTLHLSTEAAAETALAFKRHNRLSQPQYVALLGKLQGATEAAQRVNLEFDRTVAVGPGNAQTVLDAVKAYITVVDGILADGLLAELDKSTLGQVRTNLAAAQVVASGIQTALITLKKPVPVDDLKVDEFTATRAARTAERAFTAEDAILAADVLNIGARFVAQLSLVRGQSTAFVKAQRDAVYQRLVNFYTTQIAANR